MYFINVKDFINYIAIRVMKVKDEFGIQVVAAIVAQYILESDKGRSELAVNAKNYAGLKYNPGRVPSASGIYIKKGSEQDPETGAYIESVMQWCKFEDVEKFVRGYFEFLQHPRYADLKYCTTSEEYLKEIKDAGYATSIHYVDNLMNVIRQYDLEGLDQIHNDNIQTKPEYKYVVALDDGHGMDTAGKRTPYIPEIGRCILENEFNAPVTEIIGRHLLRCGIKPIYTAPETHDVSLSTRVLRAKEAKADLFVSTHYNAHMNTFDGSSAEGHSCYHYPGSVEGKRAAEIMMKHLSKGTIQKNRGVKEGNYYVLRETPMTALLTENGFMDDPREALLMIDKNFQEEVGREKAMAICEILGVDWIDENNESDNNHNQDNIIQPEGSGESESGNDNQGKKKYYSVQVGLYSIEENAKKQMESVKKKGLDAMIVERWV